MAKHPLLFTSDMVKAVLDDRKTQTRRVPIERYRNWKVGDMIWVREAWWDKGSWETDKEYKRHWVRWPSKEERIDFYYDADGHPENIRGSYTSFGSCVYLRKHPSIHMFRKDARIFLEITGLRDERVQDIDAVEAEAEGIRRPKRLCPDRHDEYILERFQKLWDSINASRGYGWDENPWVRVIEFKNITEALKS